MGGLDLEKGVEGGGPAGRFAVGRGEREEQRATGAADVEAVIGSEVERADSGQRELQCGAVASDGEELLVEDDVFGSERSEMRHFRRAQENAERHAGVFQCGEENAKRFAAVGDGAKLVGDEVKA